MARVTLLGRRGRHRLSLEPPILATHAQNVGEVRSQGGPTTHATGGHRGRGPGSESAGYHYDGSVPNPHPATPTVAPPASEAPTTPAGLYPGASRDYGAAVAALPPPVRSVVESQQPSLTPSLVSLAAALAPLAPSPVGTALKTVLGSSDGASALETLLGAKQPAPNPKVPSSPPESKLASLSTDHRDPLGAKTLGNVTLQQLEKAGRRGTLEVNQGGKLTIPVTRRAARALTTAQRIVRENSGIQGITYGPTATRFAEALVRNSHLDPRFVGAWVQAEGAGETGNSGGEAGRNNWLGVGYPAHRTPFSESPYFNGSPERAGKATAEWIEGKIGGDYGYAAAPSIRSILPRAAGKGPQAALRALEQSGWGTNVPSIAQNLPMITASQPSASAVQALRVAKHQAKQLGINPTPFNGDVEGGGEHTVYVRADAKGMVQWVESAQGTSEGSPKQLRWASNEGLSSSQPWCANFVSNGLARRGVPLPPNPNYVGSYETEWSGGRNIGTDLAKAKPGDLIAFSGEHIGVYVGNGEMVSGNFGNEVARSPVSAGPAAVSAILRPNYKGGKVAVQESTPLPGSTATGAFSGGSGVGGAVPAGTVAAGGGGRVGAVPLTELQAPISASPVLAGSAAPGEPEGEDTSAELLELLASGRPAARRGLI